MKVRLWFISETANAYRYSKLPPERKPQAGDMVWLPKSEIEHRTKRDDEHEVTIPDWLGEAKGL